MVTEVVADVHLLYLAVLVLRLNEHVLEEVVVMFLKKVRVGFHFRALHSIIREEEGCSKGLCACHIVRTWLRRNVHNGR